MAKQMFKAKAVAMAEPSVEEQVLEYVVREHNQGMYKNVRNLIELNRESIETETIKLQLLKLWEESLYRDFVAVKSELRPDAPVNLSSSMRYKLRKKHPFPIELEHELRVKNARLPKHVHDGLNAWLKTHKENPYPNKKEKEQLARHLGISAQQVNRWFIQRRKMIRIRGENYVGRFDSPEEEFQQYLNTENGAQIAGIEDQDENVATPQQQQQPNEHEQAPMAIAESNQSPMLEQLLKLRAQSPNTPQLMPTASYLALSGATSGGSMVELSDAMLKARLYPSSECHLVLTPPPSLSGDSVHPRSARSTPPDSVIYEAEHDQDQAMDLTQSNPVPNANARPVILNRRSSSTEQKVEKIEVDPSLEADAAKALMILAGGSFFG